MKRSKWFVVLASVAVASLTMTACSSSSVPETPAADGTSETPAAGGTSEGDELQKVSFLLNWTVGGDHAAYFVAKEKGWYEENGLDVEITFGKGSATTAIGVAAGKFDLGLADASSIIQVAGQAAPLEMIGMVYALGPQTGWAKKDSGIVEPADFAGKKIGTPPGDAQRILFPALAATNDIDPDSITWVNVEGGAKVAALVSDSVDVIFDFENGQANWDKAFGKDNYNKILWRDYGVNLYGNALFTSQDFATEHEDLVKGFLDASYRGWAWVMENPDEALELLHDAVPELDLPTGKENMPIALRLMKDPGFAEHGIGWMDSERMCQTVDVVQQYLEVEAKPDCDSLYTNEYLPGVPLPKNMRP